MVLEHRSEYDLQWAAISSISAKFGCTAETLRRWVRQAERDRGLRPGTTSADAERLKQLERENRELRQANEILRKASAYFALTGSTAASSPDGVHRRTPRRLRGRADLQGAADRSVDVLHAGSAAGRSGAAPEPRLAG
jgi:transposase